VESVVTVAMVGGQCVVIQLKLNPDNTTVVYDFRKDKPKEDWNKWVEHETDILNRCGITKNQSGPKWLMRYHNWNKDLRRKFMVEQTNDADSGPIACRILWELLCPGSVEDTFGKETIGRKGEKTRRLVDDVNQWRQICIVELITMTKQYGRKILDNKGAEDGDKDDMDDYCNERDAKRVCHMNHA
jgi:hypothetical protein